MEKGDYAALKNLIYCELLFQKNLLIFERRKIGL